MAYYTVPTVVNYTMAGIQEEWNLEKNGKNFETCKVQHSLSSRSRGRCRRRRHRASISPSTRQPFKRANSEDVADFNRGSHHRRHYSLLGSTAAAAAAAVSSSVCIQTYRYGISTTCLHSLLALLLLCVVCVVP